MTTQPCRIAAGKAEAGDGGADGVADDQHPSQPLGIQRGGIEIGVPGGKIGAVPTPQRHRLADVDHLGGQAIGRWVVVTGGHRTGLHPGVNARRHANLVTIAGLIHGILHRAAGVELIGAIVAVGACGSDVAGGTAGGEDRR